MGLCPRMSTAERRNAGAPPHIWALGSWHRQGLHQTPERASGNKRELDLESEKLGLGPGCIPLPAGGLGPITKVSKPARVNGVVIEDPYRGVLGETGSYLWKLFATMHCWPGDQHL